MRFSVSRSILGTIVLRTAQVTAVRGDKPVTWDGVTCMKGNLNLSYNLLSRIVLKFNTLLLISQAASIHPNSLKCYDGLRSERRIRKKDAWVRYKNVCMMHTLQVMSLRPLCDKIKIMCRLMSGYRCAPVRCCSRFYFTVDTSWAVLHFHLQFDRCRLATNVWVEFVRTKVAP